MSRTNLLMVVVWLLPVSAIAQTGGSSQMQHRISGFLYIDPAAGVSLQDAIALALKQEPSIRASRTGIDAALARRQQAALRANPTATVERRDETGGTDNQTSVGVQWPLELFRRKTRVASAEREVAVSRLDVADRERQLAADVRTRYGDALMAVRHLAVHEELLATVRRQFELVAARASEGAAPALDRDLLDVEVRRLTADHRTLMGQVESALVALKRAIGLPVDTPLKLREPLESVVAAEATTPVPMSPDAPAKRADVLAAAARIDAAETRISAAASQGRFDITLFGNYMRMDAGFPQMAFAADGGLERVRGRFHYLSAGATVTVPLVNRNQGAVAAAQADRAGAIAARDAVVLQAQADVAAATIEDTSARDAVAQYRESVRGIARKNLDVVSETFLLGRATVFDVINEQRRYLDVEKGYTEALRAAFEARTRLQLSLGATR